MFSLFFVRKQGKQKSEGKRKGSSRSKGIIREGLYKGVDCEYIVLAEINKSSGCTEGSKLVLKRGDGNRKQMLNVKINGQVKTIIAIVPDKTKFAERCKTEAKDITKDLTCKKVSGLSGMVLPPAGGGGGGGAATQPTAGAKPTTAGAKPTTAGAKPTTTGAKPTTTVGQGSGGGSDTCATGAAACANCFSTSQVNGVTYCCKDCTNLDQTLVATEAGCICT